VPDALLATVSGATNELTLSGQVMMAAFNGIPVVVWPQPQLKIGQVHFVYTVFLF